jgi:hypothetical protein
LELLLAMRVWLLTLTAALAQSTLLPQDEWVASGSGETRTQAVAFFDERAKRTMHTALVVVGAGEESTYWRNTRWRLEPNRTYAFRVRLKGEGQRRLRHRRRECGQPRLYPQPRVADRLAMCSARLSDTREAFIRVGHWHWRGEVLFAQPEFTPCRCRPRALRGPSCWAQANTCGAIDTAS